MMESRQTSTLYLPRPIEAERGHLDRNVVGGFRTVDIKRRYLHMCVNVAS